MPIAILKFKLPEEKEEFNLAQKAVDYSLVIHEFAQYLRAKTKYSDCSEEQMAIYEEVRAKFYDIVQEYNVET